MITRPYGRGVCGSARTSVDRTGSRIVSCGGPEGVVPLLPVLSGEDGDSLSHVGDVAAVDQGRPRVGLVRQGAPIGQALEVVAGKGLPDLISMFADLTLDIKFARLSCIYLGGFRRRLTCFGPYFGRRSVRSVLARAYLRVVGIPRLRGGKLVPAIRGRDALESDNASRRLPAPAFTERPEAATKTRYPQIAALRSQ